MTTNHFDNLPDDLKEHIYSFNHKSLAKCLGDAFLAHIDDLDRQMDQHNYNTDFLQRIPCRRPYIRILVRRIAARRRYEAEDDDETDEEKKDAARRLLPGSRTFYTGH